MVAEERPRGKRLPKAEWSGTLRMGEPRPGMTMNEPQKFPKGWDADRVQQLIDYYDGLSDEERVAEDEAALAADGFVMMAVPTELVDEVRALIARKQSA